MTSDAALIDEIDRCFGGQPDMKTLGVAVSGGSDSLALLHLLADWGHARIMAATVDHGLRPEAADEAAYVARFCEGLGIPHRTLRWQGWDGRGNLQDHARRNRYALLARWAAKANLRTVCLGHTQDDQAETFLMRLSRESGLDGLVGMPLITFRYGMRFDRPLLRLGRQDLRDYLERKGVVWLEDPSNDDDGFDRIKARQALEALKPLGITSETIAQTITNLRLERILIGEHARMVALRVVKVLDGDLVFDRAGLRQLNPELQRRLLSAAFRWIASEAYPPRRDTLADAILAIDDTRNVTLHGCLMLNSDMTVRITREFNAVRSEVSPPGQLWDGRWTIDGPDMPDAEVRPLGDGILSCPGWRDTGHPRQSLLASPAIWRGDELVAAPVAGFSNGWTATTPNRDHFAATLISR